MTAVVVADNTPAAPIVVATVVTEAATAVVIADAADVGAGAVVVVAVEAVAVQRTVRATLLRSRTLVRDATSPLPNTLRPPANHVATIAVATAASSPAILSRAAATIAATKIAVIVAETAAVTVAAPRAALNRAVVSHAAKAPGKVHLPLHMIRPKNQLCCPVNR
jgi:hypothetical protein